MCNDQYVTHAKRYMEYTDSALINPHPHKKITTKPYYYYLNNDGIQNTKVVYSKIK